MTALIFDLDLTLIDSSNAEMLRKQREWQKVYSSIPSFQLYEGMEEVFKFIQNNNTPVAIVTSSPKTYCEKVVNYWGIPYNVLVCYHDTKQRKPHPEPVLLAIDSLKESFDEIDNFIGFGDVVDDITAYKLAQIISVGCLWGATNHASLLNSQPHYIIKKPIEILNIIS